MNTFHEDFLLSTYLSLSAVPWNLHAKSQSDKVETQIFRQNVGEVI